MYMISEIRQDSEANADITLSTDEIVAMGASKCEKKRLKAYCSLFFAYLNFENPMSCYLMTASPPCEVSL